MQKKELKTKNRIYHTTSFSDIKSIVADGLRPSRSGHRNGIEADIEEVARRKCLNYPITRQECVFCYPTFEQAVQYIGFECPTSKSFISSPRGVIVLDRRKISSQMFLGEFNLMSDAIDYAHGHTGDEVTISDSYEEAITQYAESLRSISLSTQLATACERYENPEIVVAGTIPPDAIVEVISLKRIKTT